MFWYLSSSIAMGIAFLLIYLYYLHKGQFEESEDVKFQIFRDEENENH